MMAYTAHDTPIEILSIEALTMPELYLIELPYATIDAMISIYKDSKGRRSIGSLIPTISRLSTQSRSAICSSVAYSCAS